MQRPVAREAVDGSVGRRPRLDGESAPAGEPQRRRHGRGEEYRRPGVQRLVDILALVRVAGRLERVA
eukprot:5762574-Prymnesium_polylepis.1